MIAKEPQNQVQLDNYFSHPPQPMGPWTTHIWRSDPRHLVFTLARYKFVAKMLAGKSSALEVGCGDAFGTPIIAQAVSRVHGIDLEPFVIEDLNKRNELKERCTFAIHDMIAAPVKGSFDAAYSLDVIEHIPTQLEKKFVGNIVASLKPNGMLLMGTPNIEAHRFASEGSRLGHINLKSGDTLGALLAQFFENVFIFSMNDEVVHTGFTPMAHYLMAMGVGLKR